MFFPIPVALSFGGGPPSCGRRMVAVVATEVGDGPAVDARHGKKIASSHMWSSGVVYLLIITRYQAEIQL